MKGEAVTTSVNNKIVNNYTNLFDLFEDYNKLDANPTIGAFFPILESGYP